MVGRTVVAFRSKSELGRTVDVQGICDSTSLSVWLPACFKIGPFDLRLHTELRSSILTALQCAVFKVTVYDGQEYSMSEIL